MVNEGINEKEKEIIKLLAQLRMETYLKGYEDGEQSKKQKEIVLDYELINKKQFCICAANERMYKVNKFQARLLSREFGIKIYWCSMKKDGEEFDAYLADLGYGDRQDFIHTLLYEATQNVFDHLKNIKLCP